MVSYYFSDQQVAEMSQKTQQSAGKGSKEEVNIDVNNAGFKLKIALQMF